MFELVGIRKGVAVRKTPNSLNFVVSFVDSPPNLASFSDKARDKGWLGRGSQAFLCRYPFFGQARTSAQQKHLPSRAVTTLTAQPLDG